MLNFTKSQKKKFQSHLNLKSEAGKHEKKLWKKVQKYNSLFGYIPGIECIFVCNSLAMNAAHENSDIDLFIITRKNRLWTARIYLTLLFTLLGERKTAKKHAGKFCLSFFISKEHLSLENIALKNDIYLYFWIQTLIPIVNKNNCYEDFRTINSLWCAIENLMQPSSLGKSEEIQWRDDTKSKRPLRAIGDIQEKILKLIFLPRTKKSFQKLGKPFGIIITNTMLKFHNDDQRKIMSDLLIQK